jgi:hypothetical protein
MRLIVLTIRVRNIALGIVEESENMVKIKSNCAGQINESLYSGSYNDTVETINHTNGCSKYIPILDILLNSFFIIRLHEFFAKCRRDACPQQFDSPHELHVR